MNIFKNSSGAHLLKSIFFEYDDITKSQAIYTLKDYDHTVDGKLYPSLRRLYVELEDPTEYEFATKYLDSWSHWKKLSAASFFTEHLNDWREELSVRLRAQAVNRIKVESKSGSKAAFQANKFLVAGQWTEKSSPVGRPTKEKIKSEAEKLFKESSVVDDDFDRIVGGVQ